MKINEGEHTPSAVAAYKYLQQAFGALYNQSDIVDILYRRELIQHSSKTPERTADAIFDLFRGCWQDPEKILNSALFNTPKCDELIYQNDVSFVSVCLHHTLPFLGKAHFAYLPKDYIVGISKIPRLIECFACRPQIQEQLAQDIVETFMRVVDPSGCGVVIEAWHLCEMIRGVEQKTAYTKTSALRGAFKTNDSLKQEFLNGIRRTSEQIWP